jgi:5-methylcytosine-specific restriction protein A
MATIPKSTKCSFLGCREERSRYNSYCLTHGGKNTLTIAKQRAENNAMYQTAYWRAQRKRQLSIHPLCASCITKGIVTQAHHVDHVFPWTAIGEHAFTANIYQSLCAPCHSDKTYWEQQGIVKHYGYNDYKIEDYARVVKSLI